MLGDRKRWEDRSKDRNRMFLFNCAEHIDQEIEFALNGARRLKSPQGDITMTPRHPIAHLPTHEVTNMPPHLGDMIIAKLSARFFRFRARNPVCLGRFNANLEYKG